MDSRIFQKESHKAEKDDSWRQLKEEWKSTIDCQLDYEETQELIYKKPLWYDLSFILASRRSQINLQSPESIFTAKTRKLLGLSSPSGLFPGLLTTETQEQMAFEEETYRDNYWQTTFEIPYILWKYGTDYLRNEDFNLGDGSQSSTVPEKKTKASQTGESGQGLSPSRGGGYMVKKHQFANANKLIDPRGLVEISDDWLQEGPEGLQFGFKPTLPTCPNSAHPGELGVVVSETWGTHYGQQQDKAPGSFMDEKGMKGLVVNVPRGYGEEKSAGINQTLVTNSALRKELGKTRDVQRAKKRLVWLPKADRETTLVCYLASPPGERDEISAFFDRHASYDKYFSDGTAASLNEWETELHLSFYRLAGLTALSDFEGEAGIPNFSYIVARPQGTQETRGYREESSGTVMGLTRATMSFWFIGDFFDRYWTCHFLEYIPEAPPKEKIESQGIEMTQGKQRAVSILTPGTKTTEGEDHHAQTLKERMSKLGYDPIESPPGSEKYKHPWQQRKVLELLLFDQILMEIEVKTKQIFQWARENVLKTPGCNDKEEYGYSGVNAQELVLGKIKTKSSYPHAMAASCPLDPLAEAIASAYRFLQQGDSEGYFKIIGRWRLFEEILQTVGEDLDENLERIEEWSTREKDREPENPRWTRNDERTFRHRINKLRVQNQRRIRDLEHLKARIQTFRDSLTGRLDSIREDVRHCPDCEAFADYYLDEFQGFRKYVPIHLCDSRLSSSWFCYWDFQHE